MYGFLTSGVNDGQAEEEATTAASPEGPKAGVLIPRELIEGAMEFMDSCVSHYKAQHSISAKLSKLLKRHGRG